MRLADQDIHPVGKGFGSLSINWAMDRMSCVVKRT